MQAKVTSSLIVIGAIVCLAAGPAVAAGKASKQETIGVGMGATVGAIAGGPVGFIVGAAIGAKLGDEFHRKDAEITALTGSLEDSKGQVSTLERRVAALDEDIDVLTRDLERVDARARPKFQNLLQAGIEMDLLFRTAEHELPATTRERLVLLGERLAGMPDVSVQLDGFADERGDADYNRALSVRRAESVRQILEDSGVAAERIRHEAHGESPAADDTADSYALERKVSLTLFVEEAPALASNPD